MRLFLSFLLLRCEAVSRGTPCHLRVESGDVGSSLVVSGVAHDVRSAPLVSQVLSFSLPCVLHCPQKMSLIICPVGQRLLWPELLAASFVLGTPPELDI